MALRHTDAIDVVDAGSIEAVREDVSPAGYAEGIIADPPTGNQANACRPAERGGGPDGGGRAVRRGTMPVRSFRPGLVDPRTSPCADAVGIEAWPAVVAAERGRSAG